MASFENFKPIFGEPKPELLCLGSGSGLLRRCLFHVYASDSQHLTLHITDFSSGSWEAVLSVSQLDDMRDTVGVGGSWSEFVDYMVASLKSDNVKLVLDGTSESEGVGSSRLISQKAKGMPRITIPLKKIVDSAASDAMANLSLDLFKTFKSMQHLQEREHCSTMLSGKEKDETTSSQLDLQLERDKLQKMDSLEKPDVSAPSANNGLDSPAKQAARDINSTKAPKRVPVYRRARKRGALLQDSEDEKGE